MSRRSPIMSKQQRSIVLAFWNTELLSTILAAADPDCKRLTKVICEAEGTRPFMPFFRHSRRKRPWGDSPQGVRNRSVERDSRDSKLFPFKQPQEFFVSQHDRTSTAFPRDDRPTAHAQLGGELFLGERRPLANLLDLVTSHAVRMASSQLKNVSRQTLRAPRQFPDCRALSANSFFRSRTILMAHSKSPCSPHRKPSTP